MWLLSLSTVSFDMCRSFLALEATVLALRYGPSFLGHECKFTVWATVVSNHFRDTYAIAMDVDMAGQHSPVWLQPLTR